MPVIDVDSLLEPVSAESPAGPDLEYDPAVLDVMRLAQGTPERVMGGVSVPAEAPEWPRVQAMCVEILGRSKDLRIAQLLVRALLHGASLPGLHAGMQVFHGLVARYWDTVYPAPDPGDDNDAVERMNVVASLADPDQMLAPLREAPLITSRVFGSVSFKDLEVAQGKAKPRADKDALDEAAVNAAFIDCPVEELSRAAHSAAAVFDELQALVADLSKHVQATDIPSLDSLQDLLGSIRAELQLRLNERRPAAATDGTPSVSDMAAASGIGPAGTAPAHQQSHIGSRDDVVRSLDALCEYYRRHEPSSPVPLLLQRARRLVTMEFLDIVRDLVPEAMDKLSVIKGPNSDES